MSPRPSLVVKLVAVWFVVLIVLPFTAPFRVWDTRAPICKLPTQDPKNLDKPAPDADTAMVLWCIDLLTGSVALPRPAKIARARLKTLHAVLRL